jgi:hypothetical protein
VTVALTGPDPQRRRDAQPGLRALPVADADQRRPVPPGQRHEPPGQLAAHLPGRLHQDQLDRRQQHRHHLGPLVAGIVDQHDAVEVGAEIGGRQHAELGQPDHRAPPPGRRRPGEERQRQHPGPLDGDHLAPPQPADQRAQGRQHRHQLDRLGGETRPGQHRLGLVAPQNRHPLIVEHMFERCQVDRRSQAAPHVLRT